MGIYGADIALIIKKTIRVICFILGFIFIYNSVAYVLKADDHNKQRFSGFYYQEDNSIDVVYIGASSVFPYWASPLAWHEYGFTSWPLSTNVQQPVVAKYLIKECRKTQTPKVIIIDLRTFLYPQTQLDDDEQWEAWTRSVTDNMKMSINKICLINKLVADGNVYPFYFNLVVYHSLWKNVTFKDLEYWNLEKIDLRGGNEINDVVIDLAGQWNDYSMITDCSSMPQEQESVLRDLLDYCRNNNLEVLFTINPYAGITLEQQKTFNYMKRIISNEYAYSYIDFNNIKDELDLDLMADFYNSHHLNTRGAVKFTRYLADYLVKNYDLENKQKSIRCLTEWNDMYEFWNAKAQIAIKTIEQKVKDGNYDK